MTLTISPMKTAHKFVEVTYLDMHFLRSLVSFSAYYCYKTRQTAITVTSRARQYIKTLLGIKVLEGYSYGALLVPTCRETGAEGG